MSKNKSRLIWCVPSRQEPLPEEAKTLYFWYFYMQIIGKLNKLFSKIFAVTMLKICMDGSNGLYQQQSSVLGQ
jgi:hypothetical protein